VLVGGWLVGAVNIPLADVPVPGRGGRNDPKCVGGRMITPNGPTPDNRLDQRSQNCVGPVNSFRVSKGPLPGAIPAWSS
jgi:hypothetical protein